MWYTDLVLDHDTLKKIQRRFVTLSFGRLRLAYKDRLRMANLINFYQRRLQGDLILAFRIMEFNFGELNAAFSVNLSFRTFFKVEETKFQNTF